MENGIRIIGDSGHYAPGSDTNHFLGRCDECDVHYMAKMNVDEVESHYRSGAIGQDAYEAYMHVWATSASRYSSVAAGHENPPTEFPRAMEMVTLLRTAAGVEV